MHLTPAARSGRQIPRGIICMWSGSIATIPAGWAFCNGANGTPDLRDRFVICPTVDIGDVPMTIVTGVWLQSGGTVNHMHEISGDEVHEGTGARVLDTETTWEKHVPPFFALAYIMKL